MKCYSDFEMEYSFIQKLEHEITLPDKGAHLKSCSFCRERYENLTEHYGAYENYLKNKSSHREVFVASSIGGSGQRPKIIAYPLPVIYPDSAEISGPEFLAAATSQPEHSPDYSLIGIMSTPDKKVILRFLRPYGIDTTTLYLISDDSELCDHAPVKFLPGKNQFISDGTGKIILKDCPPNINEMQAEIMQPLLKYKFSPEEIDQLKLTKNLLCKLNNGHDFSDSIRFDINSKNQLIASIKSTKTASQIMLIQSNKPAELLAFSNNSGVFKIMKPDDLVEFRIFI